MCPFVRHQRDHIEMKIGNVLHFDRLLINRHVRKDEFL